MRIVVPALVLAALVAASTAVPTPLTVDDIPSAADAANPFLLASKTANLNNYLRESLAMAREAVEFAQEEYGTEGTRESSSKPKKRLVGDLVGLTVCLTQDALNLAKADKCGNANLASTFSTLGDQLNAGDNPFAVIKTICQDSCISAIVNTAADCNNAAVTGKLRAPFIFIRDTLCNNQCTSTVQRFLGSFLSADRCGDSAVHSAVAFRSADRAGVAPLGSQTHLRSMNSTDFKNFCENCCTYDLVFALYSMDKTCWNGVSELLSLGQAPIKKAVNCLLGISAGLMPIVCAPDTVDCLVHMDSMGEVPECTTAAQNSYADCGTTCGPAMQSKIDSWEHKCCIQTILDRTTEAVRLGAKVISSCSGVSGLQAPSAGMKPVIDNLKAQCSVTLPEACPYKSFLNDNTCKPSQEAATTIVLSDTFPTTLAARKAAGENVAKAAAAAANINVKNVRVTAVNKGSTKVSLQITKFSGDSFDAVEAGNTVRTQATAAGTSTFKTQLGSASVDATKTTAETVAEITIPTASGGAMADVTGLTQTEIDGMISGSAGASGPAGGSGLSAASAIQISFFTLVAALLLAVQLLL